jgi:hypothetical protein
MIPMVLMGLLAAGATSVFGRLQEQDLQLSMLALGPLAVPEDRGVVGAEQIAREGPHSYLARLTLDRLARRDDRRQVTLLLLLILARRQVAVAVVQVLE